MIRRSRVFVFPVSLGMVWMEGFFSFFFFRVDKLTRNWGKACAAATSTAAAAAAVQSRRAIR